MMFKYYLSAILSRFLNISIYIFFTEVLFFNYYLSIILKQVFIVIFNYKFQKKFIFKKINSFKHFLILNIFFLIINLLISYILIYILNINHIISQLGVILILSPIYYMVMRKIEKIPS